MSRPLRIECPGGLYHVTSRGDRREAIYLDVMDRQQWLTLFGQVCQRFNWVCHAYCLMDNHFHIVVETVEGNLSAGMRQLNGVYTQWHNRAHDRVGQVFQGRFKAIVVQRESYLLELARYIVLNPVRAGICALPQHWSWSSYQATVGTVPLPEWLQTAWLLSQKLNRGVEMENAINTRAAGVFSAGAAWAFHASSFAGVDEGGVAIQDLTPLMCKLDA